MVPRVIHVDLTHLKCWIDGLFVCMSMSPFQTLAQSSYHGLQSQAILVRKTSYDKSDYLQMFFHLQFDHRQTQLLQKDGR